MKKKYLPFLFVIPAAFLFFHKPDKVQSEKVTKTSSQTKPLPLSPAMASLSREPAKENQEREPVELPLGKKHRRERRDWESVVGIGRDLKILKNVFAVKTETYTPSLGDAVGENGDFTMVNSSSRPEGGSPVAYDKANGRYYTVSSIVKVSGVTPEIRSDLNLPEYYYAENLNVLFVESSPEKVVDLYQELQEKGLHVELEIIRPARIPR